MGPAHFGLSNLSFSFFEDEYSNFKLMPTNPYIKIQREINGVDWNITSCTGCKWRVINRDKYLYLPTLMRYLRTFKEYVIK